MDSLITDRPYTGFADDPIDYPSTAGGLLSLYPPDYIGPGFLKGLLGVGTKAFSPALLGMTSGGGKTIAQQLAELLGNKPGESALKEAISMSVQAPAHQPPFGVTISPSVKSDVQAMAKNNQLKSGVDGLLIDSTGELTSGGSAHGVRQRIVKDGNDLQHSVNLRQAVLSSNVEAFPAGNNRFGLLNQAEQNMNGTPFGVFEPTNIMGYNVGVPVTQYEAGAGKVNALRKLKK